MRRTGQTLQIFATESRHINKTCGFEHFEQSETETNILAPLSGKFWRMNQALLSKSMQLLSPALFLIL